MHNFVDVGQTLLANGPSLAAELSALDSDEVSEQVKKENSEVAVLLFFLRFFIVTFGFSIFSRILWW